MDYLVDTHCHLHDSEFFTAAQQVAALKKARDYEVRRIICIGTSVADSRQARDYAATVNAGTDGGGEVEGSGTREYVYWTYGVHPENAGLDAGADYAAELAKLVSGAGLLDEEPGRITGASRPIAIGEVGLDYHYDGYDREAQIRLFEQMLQLACDEDLPVSFHIRDGYADFFPVVANFPGVRGVVHCFTDSKKTLRRILEETDFYVAVNGLATYATIATPPLERILLETDAPFLTPVPFRGIINEPAYVRNVAEWLGAKLGLTLEEIKRETSKNAEQLFRFPDSVV